MNNVIGFICVPFDYKMENIKGIEDSLKEKYDIILTKASDIFITDGKNILENYIKSYLEQYKAYNLADVIIVPPDWDKYYFCKAYIKFAYHDNKDVFIWVNNELNTIAKEAITIDEKGDGDFEIKIADNVAMFIDSHLPNDNTSQQQSTTGTTGNGTNDKLKFVTNNEEISYKHGDLTVNAFKTENGAVRIEIIHNNKRKYILL